MTEELIWVKNYIPAVKVTIDASQENKNIPQLFLDRVSQYGDRHALFVKREGKYQPISWKQWAAEVLKTAIALMHFGIHARQCVAIMSDNRPEWTYVDLAALSLGAVVVPIYPTSSVQDIQFILDNSESRILFVSSMDLYSKVRALAGKTKVEKIILFTEEKMPQDDPIGENYTRFTDIKITQSDELAYHSQVARVSPSDIATIIYTSGTTGNPKGVMLTHHNFVANYLGAKTHVPASDRDLALSFLPLSHVFERLAGYYFIMMHGGSIAYAENMKTVADDIQLIKPTFVASVPRFYEKIYAQICQKVEKASPGMRKLFYWAVDVGHQIADAKTRGMRIGFSLNLQYAIAKALIFNKIKKKLGGRIRFFISGGAPLAPELAKFFYAAGVTIIEGYGLTETSPVIACNHPDSIRFGTVGRPIPNIEVQISDEGEILTKGVCVMKGYYQNDAATAQAVSDGWFRTGDLGSIDEDGYLSIVGRIKDIIVTSGGKNISPQRIEEKILQDPFFVQAVVLGDKRNYLVALIVPNFEDLKRYADERKIQYGTADDLLKNPLVYEWVNARIQKLTVELAPFEQIKYFALLSKELTMADGEVTPTLKIRRQAVMEKYKKIIDELYQKGEFYKALDASNGQPL